MTAVMTKTVVKIYYSSVLHATAISLVVTTNAHFGMKYNSDTNVGMDRWNNWKSTVNMDFDDIRVACNEEDTSRDRLDWRCRVAQCRPILEVRERWRYGKVNR